MNACIQEHFFDKSTWRIRLTEETRSVFEVGSEQLQIWLYDAKKNTFKLMKVFFNV